MVAIIGAIAGFFVKHIADKAAAWTVMRAALLFFGTVILPVVLYNFVMQLLLEYLTWVSSKMSAIQTGGVQVTMISLTGLGAWLAIQLKLPEAFALILAAVKVRLILNTLPGVK